MLGGSHTFHALSCLDQAHQTCHDVDPALQEVHAGLLGYRLQACMELEDRQALGRTLKVKNSSSGHIQHALVSPRRGREAHMVLRMEANTEPSHITAGSSKDVTSQMYVGFSLSGTGVRQPDLSRIPQSSLPFHAQLHIYS